VPTRRLVGLGLITSFGNITYWIIRRNHKQVCNSTGSENFVRLQRLSQNFMANPPLIFYIQQYCALAFDLTAAGGCHPERARRIIVDIGIEPVEITTFLKLPLPDEVANVPRPIRGMLQVTAITKYPESQAIPEDRMVLWRNIRNGAVAAGLGNHPIILVEYRLRENLSTITTTMPIPPPILEIVRERKPFECVSAFRGKFEKPMTENNVIEYVPPVLFLIILRTQKITEYADPTRQAWTIQAPG